VRGCHAGDDRITFSGREWIGRLFLVLGALEGIGWVSAEHVVGDGKLKGFAQHADVVVDGLAGKGGPGG